MGLQKMEYYEAIKKGNAICDNREEPAYYIKQYKPDKVRQIWHDLIYIWNLKK